ncbi:MAG: hypothetical protein FD123_1479 [Bacteroidetes bacterium]|nr:MAG: hypothetical protein FD123_1479 [Bacteroidota bacterium]
MAGGAEWQPTVSSVIGDYRELKNCFGIATFDKAKTDFMTVLQKRKQVSDFLKKKADDRFINMVYALMQEYAAKLEPMTEEDLLGRIRKSRNDVKSGRVYSHADVKKRFRVKK